MGGWVVGRRPRAVLLSLTAALGVAVPGARAGAQSQECDPGEREVRSLDFRGNTTFSDDELSVRVNTTPSTWARRIFRIFGTRRCLDSGELARDVLRLRLFYGRAGFPNATVDTTVTPSGKNQVRVAFDIVEGEPIRIEAVHITGLDSVPNRNRILSGLYLGVGKRFDLFRLQADYDTIIARLRNSGYPRADVLQGADVRPESLLARVEPFVDTGPFARFDGVKISVTPQDSAEGQQISDRVVKRLLGIDSGDVYRDRDIVNAQRNLYQTGAYRHVEVAALPDSLQSSDSLVALRVNLVEDYMKQLDGEIGWATLDCFRTRAVYTNKNLLGTARRLELTGQLSKIGFGKPFATDQSKNLCSSQLRQDPFSEQANYFVGASIRQPALFGTSAVPALTVYREHRGEYKVYGRTTLIGGDLSLLKNLGLRTTPLRLGYSWEFGKTDAQPAMLCAVFRRCDEESRGQLSQARPLAIASATIARVRTDNELAPTNGNILRAEVRASSQLIGSDSSLTFSKGFLDGVWYKSLGAGNVLALRLRGGIVFGGQGINGGPKLPPPQERLFAGGATSVRGFQQNELGAAVYLLREDVKLDTLVVGDTSWIYVTRDAGFQQRGVIPVGGNSLVVANIEYRLRSPFLSDLLQYTLFADGGYVWTRGDNNESFGFLSIKWTPGVGLRVFSPFGPVQVNVAYNPHARPQGPAYFGTREDVTVGDRTVSYAPLYCVASYNDRSTTPLIDQVRSRGIPATYQNVIVDNVDIGPRLVQSTNLPCRSNFEPHKNSRFTSLLTLTFSIGPDF